MSNETIQQVMRDMLKMALATCEVEKAKASEKKAIAGKDRDEERAKIRSLRTSMERDLHWLASHQQNQRPQKGE